MRSLGCPPPKCLCPYDKGAFGRTGTQAVCHVPAKAEVGWSPGQGTPEVTSKLPRGTGVRTPGKGGCLWAEDTQGHQRQAGGLEQCPTASEGPGAAGTLVSDSQPPGRAENTVKTFCCLSWGLWCFVMAAPQTKTVSQRHSPLGSGESPSPQSRELRPHRGWPSRQPASPHPGAPALSVAWEALGRHNGPALQGLGRMSWGKGRCWGSAVPKGGPSTRHSHRDAGWAGDAAGGRAEPSRRRKGR